MAAACFCHLAQERGLEGWTASSAGIHAQHGQMIAPEVREALAEIGLHRLSPDAFTQAIATGDRIKLGMTAPPQGLELTEVRYPEQAFTDPESLRWHQPDKE